MEASLVVDIGSSSTKVGFSGEDHPSWVFPTTTQSSLVSKYQESLEHCTFDPSAESIGDLTDHGVLMHRGLVQDWDEMDNFYDMIHTEVSMSALDIEKTPVLLIDNPKAPVNHRARWAEILFGYGVPSLCIGNSASCGIFAAGRTTGVVVDCGAGCMTSVPVFEGLALSHACIEMDYAGMDITTNLRKLIKDKHGITIDYRDSQILKERLANVHTTKPIVTKGKAKRGKENTEEVEMTKLHLPDGNEVELEKKIFTDCTEAFIDNDKTTYGGLSKAVYESLILCDDSIMGDLKRNIIIAGGTSMLSGLGDRLSNDLNTLFANAQASQKAANNETDPYDTMMKANTSNSVIQVSPSTSFRESGYTQQRKFSPWVGGSIFASFDSFKSTRVSKQDYEETGEAALLAKCF